jgi:hypothetical protein
MTGRVTAALLDSQAYSENANAKMLDLTYGGQHGYAPDLTQWVSNGAYVRRNIICILIEAPKFFDYLTNKDKWVSALKALFELHAQSIEGLNAELTVETTSTPVGGAGEVQEEIVDVKRAPSSISFNFGHDKYGRPIQTFISDWITMGMMNPDSKIPGIATLTGNKPDDMLADMYSATCIFIEPDATGRKVIHSWLATNMFPKGTGAIEGKRDLTAAMEMPSLSIPFSSICQYNLGGNVLAQRMLDNIVLNNANPNMRAAFVSGISADAAAASGYKEGVDTLASSSIGRA